ncbi:MAG: Bax inhibitor-1/YccA family protein [Saprospiraceae bacterium]
MSKLDRFSKSNNPMLKDEVYQQNAVLDEGMIGSESGRTMTVSGAVNKTFILFAIMLGGAGVGFMFPSTILMWVGILGGAAIYFIASRNPARSPILAPLYAVVEGLLVGTVTSYYMYSFEGIVFNAVTLTMAILFMMLTLYKAGVIKVTEKFRAGVSMAVGAVMLLYLVNIVLHFIGIDMPFLHDGGLFSIGISAVIIGIASLNLLLDFDSFDKGEAYGAPEYMEWYSAMGLLFTLVWLYLEILRLLSYLSND